MKRIFCALLAGALTLGAALPVQAADAAVLRVAADAKQTAISDHLYGAFIEDISYACDGGLVSNLVNNDSFEYASAPTTGWVADGLELTTEGNLPLNKNNPTYAKVTVDGKGSLTNLGFTEIYKYKTDKYDKKKANTADMGFVAEQVYDFSCYVRSGGFTGTAQVYLDCGDGKQTAVQLDLSKTGGAWNKLTVPLTASASKDGALVFQLEGEGTLYLDFVTLVPQGSYGYGSDSWKYTTLRSDLFAALQNLHPRFIRFPGGCLAEGGSLDQLYNWKDTIGPLEERKQSENLWKDDNGRDYNNTNAMGYHEYFQLCADLNALALPIVNVGLSCQPRAAYDDHAAAYAKLRMTNAQWEAYLTEKVGLDEKDTDARTEYTDKIKKLNINSAADWEAYLDTIALRPGTDAWDNYVQDVLDLIEYANGDATTSYWGALRAANGHAKPFNLQYIGLGNENWGAVYERNFKALYKVVKEKYPQITVISSAGTYLEGDAYDGNMAWIDREFKDTVVDEHYYTYDGYLFDHNDRYDSFDRSGAHVFVGEYAATSAGIGTIETKSNIWEAVEEASYLTGLERNGDVVDMASYAPTFAKVNAQSWNVNLIWFDSRQTVLTPSYYVQMLFANNVGTQYVHATFDGGSTVQDGVYQSVTCDPENQVLYVKLVNTSGKNRTLNVQLDGYKPNAVSVQSLQGKFKSACNELDSNTTAPTQTELTPGTDLQVELSKYQVSVVQVAYGKNSGADLYKLPEKATPTLSDGGKLYLPPATAGIAFGAVFGTAAVFAAVVLLIHYKKKKQGKS